jgi:hypothetical protein
MTPVSLASLPAELQVGIASQLDSEDYGHLRLSCKQTEAALFSFFVESFFFSRQFYSDHHSL